MILYSQKDFSTIDSTEHVLFVRNTVDLLCIWADSVQSMEDLEFLSNEIIDFHDVVYDALSGIAIDLYFARLHLLRLSVSKYWISEMVQT